jgi:hypothetical protein
MHVNVEVDQSGKFDFFKLEADPRQLTLSDGSLGYFDIISSTIAQNVPSAKVTLHTKLILPDSSRLTDILGILESRIKLGDVKFLVEGTYRCSTALYAKMTWESIVLRYMGEVFETDELAFGTKVSSSFQASNS